MRQVTRKGLITMAAAGGVLALSGGYAHADAGAAGGASNSPGVLSGNSVQIPVEVPVNVCGNTVNVVGLLNPAAGNECENDSTPPPVVPTPPVHHETPPVHHETPPVHNAPEPQTLPATTPQLAHTGGGGLDLLIPASAGLLLAGAGTVLYRRAKAAA